MATVDDDDYDQEEVNTSMAHHLTDWENEPTLEKLCADLDAAKPAHDLRSLKVAEWNNLREVRGKAKPKPVKGRSQIQPKLVRRQNEWRYAPLSEPFLGSDKLFKISPASWEDRAAADQNDLVLNWQWRTKLPRVKFVDDYIRSAVDEGSVIVRLGWHRQTSMVPTETPEWTYMQPQSQDQVQMIQQAMQMKQEDPNGYSTTVPSDVQASVDYYEENQVTAVAVQTGTQMVPVEKIIDNRPTVNIINPDNFYPDPSCEGDLDKANFAVISFETSQADMLKEPQRYKNLKFVDWENATPIVNPDHTTTTPNDFNFQDVLRKRVIAYEYWGFSDIHGTGELIPIVATWVGRTLVRLEENPFPDKKLPFVIENYMPLKRDLFGEPDAELLGDNQAVLGALMRGMIDLMGRSANSQQGFAKGMLDPVNRRKFEAGMDYEFNPNSNPAVNHVEHKYPEIPQSALAMLAMQNQEAESMSGVKAFAGGISGEAYGDVAAGIRGVLDAASKREMGILRRLANGIKKVGEKIIAMNAVFLSDEEVVRVTNDKFVTVKRDDLPGNFDLIVDISTAEVDSKKAQDLGFLLQTIGPTVQDFTIVKIILVELSKLMRMPDLAHTLENYQPQPSPFDQQMQQMQLQEAQWKVRLLQSEVNLNNAKAQQAAEGANQTNLDTIEQETGTAHARDMEKMQAQAEGNQGLEVTKALLKPRKQANGQESKPDVEAAVGFNAISKANTGAINRPSNGMLQRNATAQEDPALSIHSSSYNPALDPSSNSGLNISQ